MHVYYTNIQNLTQQDLVRGFALLSNQRKEQILRSKSPLDQKRRLAASLLLSHALKKETEVPADGSDFTAAFPELEYSPKGKPTLKDHPELFFSLSHSGDYALCAMGHVPVGADLQQFRSSSLKIVDRFYTKEEQEYVNSFGSSEEQIHTFFHIWSAKEALLKLTGQGLSGGMENIKVNLKALSCTYEKDDDKKEAYLEIPLEIPGYASAISVYDPSVLTSLTIEFFDLGIALSR